jgi:hypothetical protein
LFELRLESPGDLRIITYFFGGDGPLLPLFIGEILLTAKKAEEAIYGQHDGTVKYFLIRHAYCSIFQIDHAMQKPISSMSTAL